MRQEQRDAEIALPERERPPAREPPHERGAGLGGGRRGEMPASGREHLSGQAIDAKHAGSGTRGATQRPEQVAIGGDADRGSNLSLR